MNGKRAIKKSSANNPVKKSIRFLKNKIAEQNLEDQLIDSEIMDQEIKPIEDTIFKRDKNDGVSDLS